MSFEMKIIYAKLCDVIDEVLKEYNTSWILLGML